MLIFDKIWPYLTGQVKKYDILLTIFDEKKSENVLTIFENVLLFIQQYLTRKYLTTLWQYLTIFDEEKYENLSLQLLHLISSRDRALQGRYVESSLQHWIILDVDVSRWKQSQSFKNGKSSEFNPQKDEQVKSSSSVKVYWQEGSNIYPRMAQLG